MHHYATITYRHLIIGEQQNQFWLHHAPALAADNAVLMHQILAITALHHAHRQATQREAYTTRAFQHHGMSIPGFQCLIAAASSETAEVIILGSILLSIWIFASAQLTADSSLDHNLEMLGIVRSSRMVLQLYRDVIVQTPIATLLIPPLREPVVKRTSALAEDALRLLRRQIDPSVDSDATSLLQEGLERYLAGTDYRRPAAGWVAQVGDEFWTRLRRHEPPALLVFAYSSLLSRASEHECWWLAGWSERVIMDCASVLSEEDKEAVGWNGHVGLIRTWGDEFAALAKKRNGSGTE